MECSGRVGWGKIRDSGGNGEWKSWEKIREKIRKRERLERLEIPGEKKMEKSRNERPETLRKKMGREG